MKPERGREMNGSGGGGGGGECDVEPYDLFVLFGLLVVEGRVPHVSAKGRREGPHCQGSVLATGAHGDSKQHECDKHNLLCLRKEMLQRQMAVLWKNRVPMCIEVLLFPECEHGTERCRAVDVSTPSSRNAARGLLLEQWTIQIVPRRNFEGFLHPKAVFQAIKSFLHFSQLSSWLNSSGGRTPQNVAFRISPPAEFCTSSFSLAPEVHMFPICASSRTTVLRVSVCSLARQAKLISVPCADCLRSSHCHQTLAAAGQEHGHGSDGSAVSDTPRFEQRDRSKRDSVEKSISSLSTCTYNGSYESSNAGGGPSALFVSASLSSTVKFPVFSSSSVLEDVSEGADLLLLPRQQAATDVATAFVDIPAVHYRQQMHMYCTPELAVSSPDLEDFHIRRGKLSQPVSESPKVLLTRNRVLPMYFDRKQLVCEQLQFPSSDVVAASNAEAEHEQSPDFDGLLQNTLGSRMEPLSPQEMAEQLSMVCGTPKQGDNGLIMQPQLTTENYRKQVITRRERRATELTVLSPDEPLSRTPTAGSSRVHTTPVSTYRRSVPMVSTAYQGQSKPSAKKECETGVSVAYRKSANQKCLSFNDVSDAHVVAKADGNSGLVEALMSVTLDDEVFDDETNDKRATKATSGCKRVAPTTTAEQHPVKFDLGEDVGSGAVTDDAENGSDESCGTKQQNGGCNSVEQNGTGRMPSRSQVASSGSIAELRGCHKSQSLLKSMMKKELMQNVQAKSLPRKVPSSAEQIAFQTALQKSANMIFHPATGLPMQSSPAPLKKKSSGCFAYDGSLSSPRAIKSSLSCQSLQHQNEQSEQDSETSDSRCYSTSAPASTNCLLGNFEESILNGRIEPVGVVDGFAAEIGASGSFCPQHVTLPVTAYFFSLSEDNAPSPYLGHINLESNTKRGYHVPNKGTIQLTLFNPNKTVVKMFVVLYDLSDMPPRCQTFLRQRTIYMPVRGSPSDVPDAPVFLRYLIHLRFASTKTGKIYLHTDIRLIFARDRFEYDSQVANYELRSFTECPSNPKFSPQR